MLCCVSAHCADLVTYTLRGAVNSITDADNSGQLLTQWGSFSVGSRFTLTLTVDKEAPYQPNYGVPLISSTFSLDNGGYSSTSVNVGYLKQQAEKQLLDLYDVFAVSGMEFSAHNGVEYTKYNLISPTAFTFPYSVATLVDADAESISNNSTLISDFGDINQWEERELLLAFGLKLSSLQQDVYYSQYNITGTFDQLSVVPEPSVLTFFFVAASGLFLVRSRLILSRSQLRGFHSFRIFLLLSCSTKSPVPFISRGASVLVMLGTAA